MVYINKPILQDRVLMLCGFCPILTAENKSALPKNAKRFFVGGILCESI